MGAAASRSEVKSPQQITVEFDVRVAARHSCCKLQEVGLLNFGLSLQVNVHIPMEEVIKLSEEAGKAIMTIYNSAVRRRAVGTSTGACQAGPGLLLSVHTGTCLHKADLADMHTVSTHISTCMPAD
jgi:hypothetical protein